MAKKDERSERQDRLAQLREQLADLEARQTALRGVLADADPGDDALGAVARLTSAASELAATERVADSLRLAMRREMADRERQKVLEARARRDALRPDAWAAAQEVVRAAQSLDDALAHYEAIESEAGRVQFDFVPATLRPHLQQAFEGWKFRSPELLGLPPRPTREDEAKLDAERALERAKAGLVVAQRERSEQLIRLYSDALAAAKRRLEALR